MFPPASSRAVRPFDGVPVLRRGGQWLLAAASGGTVAADQVLASELDRFAVAMAAADRVVAALSLSPGGQ